MVDNGSPVPDRPELEKLGHEAEEWWDEKGWDIRRPPEKKSLIERSPVARWVIGQMVALPGRHERALAWGRSKLQMLGEWSWRRRNDRWLKLGVLLLVLFVIVIAGRAFYQACYLSPRLLLTHCLENVLEGDSDDLLELFPPEQRRLPAACLDLCRRGEVVAAYLDGGVRELAVYDERGTTWGSISVRNGGEYLCILLKMASGNTGWVIEEIHISGSMVR